MKSACVFCGSSAGVRGVYAEAAAETGRELASRGIDLVYGGGKTGLMGVLADACLSAGGRVIGVMPKHLVDKEVAHTGLTQLHVVGSMHERKALMAAKSDAFIAMPGGIGTFEEFFEVLTWTQLGLQSKPCGLLNADGYYNHLLKMADHAVVEGFYKPPHRALLIQSEKIADLLAELEQCEIPTLGKWDLVPPLS